MSEGLRGVDGRIGLQCGHCGAEIYSSTPEGYDREALREAMGRHAEGSPGCRGLMPPEFLERLRERARFDALPR